MAQTKQQIAMMSSINGFKRGDYVTSNGMNGRVGRIEKFEFPIEGRKDFVNAKIVATSDWKGTAKTVNVDFLEHAKKTGRANKYGYVKHANGKIANLKFDKKSKDMIDENRKKYIENKNNLIRKYQGKNVKFTIHPMSGDKVIKGRIIGVDPDSGAMLGSPKTYLKVRSTDGEIYSPTIKDVSSV